jgi:hypothetical protein
MSTRRRARGARACSRSVFDHVTIRASDRAASERFYELALSTLGIEKTNTDEGAFILDPDGNNVELVNHNR